MNIPPKYEDVVAQLETERARVTDYISQRAQTELKLEAALGREAALHEEFDAYKIKRTEFAHKVGELTEKMEQIIDALQQRLTVAEQRAREMEGMLAQVVSRCDYSLSCGKDALSKNCTAEIENIKLIAGGCSGWDCFAPIEG